MSIGKNKVTAVLCGITVPFVFYISCRVVDEIGTDIRHYFKKERIQSEKNLEPLPAAEAVQTDITQHPVLKLVCHSGWTVTQTKFAMYSDGQVVWADKRSPTGYCTAKVPQEKREEILALVKNITWGKNYDMANVTDQPGYEIQFGTNKTTIYGDPNTDYYDHGQALRAALPKPLIALLNLLQSFEVEPAKPWLPNEVFIELLSESGPADPDLKTFPKRLYQSLPKEKLQRFWYQKTGTMRSGIPLPHFRISETVPTLQYKDEILELITMPRSNRREVLVDGVPCRLSIGVPCELLWTF